MRKIKTAYQAGWFLYEHPKFSVPFRRAITKQEVAQSKREGHTVARDRNGQRWEYNKVLFRHALEVNLDIHYVKTNGRGHILNDKTKNIYEECWLEFGPLQYDYHSHDHKTGKPYSWDKETTLQHVHDVRLDCGAKSFDAALVKLARLVLRHYGDYKKGVD